MTHTGTTHPLDPAADLWSPEIYGREAVQQLANSWWSLPVNKYNCWSCCVGGGENIVDDAACTSPTGRACRRGLLPMIDTQDMGTPGFSTAGHWDWAGPRKGWNHIDQLAACVGKSWYGPGLTPNEQWSQFALWSVLASPLLVSVDVRGGMTRECTALLTNARAIAVHQDKAGVPGRRLKNVGADGTALPLAHTNVSAGGAAVAAQVWGRPLSGDGVAVVMLNRGEAPTDISATFAELGLPTTVTSVASTDVLTGVVTKGLANPVTAYGVPPHGVAFITLAIE